MIAFLIWGQIFVLCIAGMLNVASDAASFFSFGTGAAVSALLAARSYFAAVRSTR